jgi:universal stress protein F
MMYKDIVIPIDLSAKYSWNAIVPQVLSLASVFSSKLHFIHVIPDYGLQMVEDYLPKNWFKDQTKKSSEAIEALMNKYIPKDIEADYHICKGAVYDAVIQYANNVSADLIVLSAVRPELKGYMLGPNASKIVRHSQTSVLVIRDK